VDVLDGNTHVRSVKVQQLARDAEVIRGVADRLQSDCASVAHGHDYRLIALVQRDPSYRSVRDSRAEYAPDYAAESLDDRMASGVIAEFGREHTCLSIVHGTNSLFAPFVHTRASQTASGRP